MANDEELEKYIQQNAPEPKKKSVKKTQATAAPYGMTLNGFILRKLPWQIIRLIMYQVGFFVIVGITLTKFLPEEQGILYTVAGMIAIALLSLGWWVSHFSTYKKWTTGAFYPFTGWTELLASRTKMFWKKEYYVSIAVSIDLKADASKLHREAVDIFLKNAIANKGKYENMDWHAGGYPNDFKSDKKSMTGDVDSVALKWLVDVLSKKFIPLAKLLGSTLDSVSLTYQGQEREFRKKSDGPDAQERNDWKSTLNSLD